MRLRRRRPDPRCPACGSALAARHAPTCRVLALPYGERTPVPYVQYSDTIALQCGCSELLVRRHGSWGHRVDHSEPDYPRPPMFSLAEHLVHVATMTVGGGLLVAAIIIGGVVGLAVASVAAAVHSSTLVLVGIRHGRRAAGWPGRKVYEAGEPGRYVTCPHCAGDGIMFVEAYPALPAATTQPSSR